MKKLTALTMIIQVMLSALSLAVGVGSVENVDIWPITNDGTVIAGTAVQIILSVFGLFFGVKSTENIRNWFVATLRINNRSKRK
ncbi:MAG: hypothetical protein R6U08_08225 [Bacillota bacterium]